MYKVDARCASWQGTAHGVLAAVISYQHDENKVLGDSRAERNQLRTVTGGFGQIDRGASRAASVGRRTHRGAPFVAGRAHI